MVKRDPAQPALIGSKGSRESGVLIFLECFELGSFNHTFHSERVNEHEE